MLQDHLLHAYESHGCFYFLIRIWSLVFIVFSIILLLCSCYGWHMV
uniref:Uncharacterized protein n=1 Tax=Lotus japonicus TaxID=34305 RepID=I3SAZ0_LOTJA|nr:unknown [Lotus japonicus]